MYENLTKINKTSFKNRAQIFIFLLKKLRDFFIKLGICFKKVYSQICLKKVIQKVVMFFIKFSILLLMWFKKVDAKAIVEEASDNEINSIENPSSQFEEFFQGDIVLTPEQKEILQPDSPDKSSKGTRTGLINVFNRWPKNGQGYVIVPYYIYPGYFS